MDFQRIDNRSNLNLYYFPTRKFKTTTIRAFFKGSLASDVESQALLPFLLKRGSVNYPTLKDISRRLETLYGSTLSLDISKMGESQVLLAGMDVINERYLTSSSDLLIHGIELFNDLLLNPFLDQGEFLQDRFNQEKTNLVRYVESIIDDKAMYTHIRLIREMFQGEPYSSYEWGDLERIRCLDRETVRRFYQRFLATAPVDVYVVGLLSKKEEERLPTLLLPFAQRESVKEPRQTRPSLATDGEVIVEEQPVEQSKLELGFRVDVTQGKESIYALVLYNAILGGGSFSKLFKTVREKASLAYYISSAFDKLKGFIYITAGINSEKFEEACERIRGCMEEIA
ncbi:MAG: insulinase family protein, partial [Planctomycetes bacterium]|nr:insulinase family protein [Planctomycetota bacterium]